jgi:prophage regulatory protein
VNAAEYFGPILDPLLRRRKVEEVTGLSCSTLYKRMAEGTFPRPVDVGGGKIAWRTSTIIEWINSRPER